MALSFVWLPFAFAVFLLLPAMGGVALQILLARTERHVQELTVGRVERHLVRMRSKHSAKKSRSKKRRKRSGVQSGEASKSVTSS